ncbi:hypothetical protein QVD17_12355 [Tagetes erecta]|uniref:Uncharacterized protein n=1 Tax=Tagetes erecta TaxID=13708 RepID=A0AAD8KWK0_TARER|nr:hypothetical protein QVD17_12355 [Tagetes erecta]
MADNTISYNLHDDQETLSLTDFAIAQEHNTSTFQDQRNASADVGDIFEFSYRGLSDYSDAKDIIFCGKLIPIKEQLHRKNPPQQSEKHHRRNQQSHPLGCRRSRSESRYDVKCSGATAVVRNKRSKDYKKLKRISSMRLEQSAGKKSQWHVLSFGLVNVPQPAMDIRDLKSRKFRLNSSKSPFVLSESVDHRKYSWRLLEFLSCKSSTTAAVTTPLSYMAKA